MEKFNDNISKDEYLIGGPTVDISQFERFGPMEIAMEMIAQHMMIILILCIGSYFIFGKKDKITFKIAGLSLLFYVILYDIINVYLVQVYFDIISVYLYNIFDIKDHNMIYATSLFGGIIVLLLNILILLPIKKYSQSIKGKIDYHKIFLLFSVYLILSVGYTLLNTQLNYGEIPGVAEHYEFKGTWLFIIFTLCIEIIPGIVIYKIIFRNKKRI